MNRSHRSLSFLGALLLAGCATGNADDAAPTRMLPSVEAVQAREGSLPLTQRLSGVVRAKNQVDVYPQISAVVTEVLVENGASVRKGQPLVRMRDTEFRQRLEQARANHQITLAQLQRAEAVAREARTELERMRSLADKQLSSPSELEAAAARAESADADVALARARIEQALASAQEQEENLAQTVVRAPIDGTMGNREVEVGMLAGPGTRLFTLGQLDSVRVDVVLTDRMLAYVHVGQRTEIRAGDSVLSAPLARISPFLHPVAHSTDAEIELPNPDGALRPGMFVSVDVFHGETERATLIPLSALHEDPATGVLGVYVTRETFEGNQVDEQGIPASLPLSEPVAFEFVPADVIAQGHMEAAVRGIAPDTWVVILGQNLLGKGSLEARVRPVLWDRVERLQRLQREDMMEELVERRASR